MATSADQYRQNALPPSHPQAQQYYPQQQPQRQSQQLQPQSQQQHLQFSQPPVSQHQRPSQNPSQNPPGRSRAHSLQSQKSHRSSGSKDFLHETPAEKEAKRLHSKADPTLAISEAEPSTLAAMKIENNFAPLRSMQHKDSFGNAIADPDKSNPTRNRWERPLDTIRSFEAAIDGGYARKSIYGGDTESVANYNRRNSSFTGGQPRFPHDSYYNGRPQSFRPEQTQFDLGSRSSYFDGQQPGGNPARQRMPRIQTDPQQGYGRNPNIYPMPNKDRSYETVTSAANSDQAGYQTDPTSSDNSSIDRSVPAKRRDPANDYGARPGQGQQQYQRGYLAPIASGQGRQSQPPTPLSAPPTTVEPAVLSAGKQKTTLLRRTSTQQTQQTQQSQQTQKADGSDKRKSWFARRFSKNP
ncbi:hypothetical protein AK830_g2917 [Neonectria ditissima]|uniref:DUF2406 domain-containing protein n=1 Tax=Neonectria ditissima TaxID=78410 RepID=A0A0P7BSD0_9HYPO|nr:hypothetical protein AK830_g2917 [Neonectria ditissima]